MQALVIRISRDVYVLGIVFSSLSMQALVIRISRDVYVLDITVKRKNKKAARPPPPVVNIFIRPPLGSARVCVVPTQPNHTSLHSW